MTKPLLLALAGTLLALTAPGAAQASLSLGPPRPAAATKAVIAPALATARFTRLPAERTRAPALSERIVRNRGAEARAPGFRPICH